MHELIENVEIWLALEQFEPLDKQKLSMNWLPAMSPTDTRVPENKIKING